MEFWPAIVFGWPSALLGGGLLASGVFFGKPRFSLIGALIAAMFCVVIALNPPPARWLALAALAGNGFSVAAVGRRAPRWAAALLLPYAILLILIAYAVVTQ